MAEALVVAEPGSEGGLDRLRYRLEDIALSRSLNNFILVAIVLNCVCMAMEDPMPGTENRSDQIVLAHLDYVFVGLFTVEMLLKLMALGASAYFRDAWNDLDFLIVVISYINIVAQGSGGNVSAFNTLRVFRVLRPLRTIKRIQGLRILVVSLLKSLPMLLNIAIIVFFMLVVFSIVGMQLYMGEFDQRCMDSETLDYPEPDGLLCLPSDALILGGRGCPDGLLCMRSGQRPSHGFVHFDNFLFALLTTFTVISTEDWSRVMYSAQDVSPIGGADVAYFVLVVLLGNYLALNLMVAVLKTELSRATAIQRLRAMERDMRKLQRRRSSASPRDLEAADDSFVSRGESSFRRRRVRLRRPQHDDEPNASPSPSFLNRKLGRHAIALPPPSLPPGDGRCPDSQTKCHHRRRDGQNDEVLSQAASETDSLAPSLSSAAMRDDGMSDDSGTTAHTFSRQPSCKKLAIEAARSSSLSDGDASFRQTPTSRAAKQHSGRKSEGEVPRHPSFWLLGSDGKKQGVASGPGQGYGGSADDESLPESSKSESHIPSLAESLRESPWQSNAASRGESQPDSKNISRASSRPGSFKLTGDAADGSFSAGSAKGDSAESCEKVQGSLSRGDVEPRRCMSRVHLPLEQTEATSAPVSRQNCSYRCGTSRKASFRDNLIDSGTSATASPLQDGNSGILRIGTGAGGGTRSDSDATQTQAWEVSASGSPPSPEHRSDGCAPKRGSRTESSERRQCSVVPPDPSTGQPQRPDAHAIGCWFRVSPARVSPPAGKSTATRTTQTVTIGRVWLQPRKWLRRLVLAPWFEHVLLGTVLLNTLCLAMEYDGMSAQYAAFLEKCNTVFTYLFMVELLVKLCALGPKAYASDRFNIFDAVISVVGFVQLQIESSLDLSAFRSLKVGRVLRLMRLTRVARLGRMVKYFHRLQEIVKVIGHSLASLLYIGMLLLLFMFIFAILGMQLFGGKFDFADRSSATSFDTFLDALIAVFLILTVEEWNLVMYDGMRALGPFAALFFVVWLVGGVYILLSLFMAVILDSFEDNAEVKHKARRGSRRRSLSNKSAPFDSESAPNKSVERFQMAITKVQAQNAVALALKGSVAAKTSPNRWKKAIDQVVVANKTASAFRATAATKSDLVGRSLGCMGPTNPVRVVVARIVRHKYFERCTLAAILLNSAAMAVEPADLQKGSTLYAVLFALDIAFTALFGVEMVLKIVAHGLINIPGSYLQSTANCFDGVVVVSSVVDLAISSSTSYDIGFVKVFRLLRALRPLRMISRLPGMRVVVGSLTRAVPGVVTHFFVIVMVMLVFSIIFPQLFLGKLEECNDLDIIRRADCVGDYVDPVTSILTERKMVRAFFNFDNTLWAFVTLFVVSTREGWPRILWNTVDSGEEGEEKGWFFLFFLYIVTVSFFLINMLTGILYKQFSAIRSEYSAATFLTRDQKNWVAVQRLVLKSRLSALPVEPKTQPRLCVFKLVRSNAFEVTIMVMIVCNIGLMAASHHNEPPLFTAVASVCNMAFSTLFLGEALLKMYGLGCRSYFSDRWNRFDFFIVLGGLVDIGFTLSQITADGTLMPRQVSDEAGADDAISTATQVGRATRVARVARLIRVFRVSRMLRLLRFLQGVVELLKAVYLSLPSLINVVSLLFLLLFMYAVAAVSLFGLVVQGSALSEHANFSTWPLAMITLIRLATGEDWHLFMRACMIRPPQCQPELKNCGSLASVPFFITFVFILTWVMLSLFVAVILENFSKSTKPAEADLQKTEIKRTHVDAFMKAWQTVSKSKTNDYLPWEKLEDLLRALQPPFGVGQSSDRSTARHFVAKLRVHNHDGLVHYREVLLALSQRLIGVEIPEASQSTKDIRRLSRVALPSKNQAADGYGMLFQTVAILRIQRAWRKKYGVASTQSDGRSRRVSKDSMMVSVLGKWLVDPIERKRRSSNQSATRQSSNVSVISLTADGGCQGTRTPLRRSGTCNVSCSASQRALVPAKPPLRRSFTMSPRSEALDPDLDDDDDDDDEKLGADQVHQLAAEEPPEGWGSEPSSSSPLRPCPSDGAMLRRQCGEDSAAQSPWGSPDGQGAAPGTAGAQGYGSRPVLGLHLSVRDQGPEGKGVVAGEVDEEVEVLRLEEQDGVTAQEL